MYKNYLTIPLLLVQAAVLAQSSSTQVGARAEGLGYASAALYDSYGIFNNVAGTAKITQSEFTASYDAAPTLPAANRAAAIANIKLKYFAMGIGVYRFGDELYNEQIFSIGVANKLGIASLGGRINVVQYTTQGYGTISVLSMDFGGIVEFTKHIAFGAYITNLNQPVIDRETGERLPTKLHAGFSFEPTKKVILCTSLEKDLEYRVTWKAGIEYSFHEKFVARTGYNVNPNASYFGLGFKSKLLKLDYGLRHSYYLGVSHQATATFIPRKK